MDEGNDLQSENTAVIMILVRRPKNESQNDRTPGKKTSEME